MREKQWREERERLGRRLQINIKKLNVLYFVYVLPGREGLQVVVRDVQYPQVCVSGQQRHTLVGEVVIGQVELLQNTAALL